MSKSGYLHHRWGSRFSARSRDFPTGRCEPGSSLLWGWGEVGRTNSCDRALSSCKLPHWSLLSRTEQSLWVRTGSHQVWDESEQWKLYVKCSVLYRKSKCVLKIKIASSDHSQCPHAQGLLITSLFKWWLLCIPMPMKANGQEKSGLSSIHLILPLMIVQTIWDIGRLCDGHMHGTPSGAPMHPATSLLLMVKPVAVGSGRTRPHVTVGCWAELSKFIRAHPLNSFPDNQEASKNGIMPVLPWVTGRGLFLPPCTFFTWLKRSASYIKFSILRQLENVFQKKQECHLLLPEHSPWWKASPRLEQGNGQWIVKDPAYIYSNITVNIWFMPCPMLPLLSPPRNGRRDKQCVKPMNALEMPVMICKQIQG